MKVLFRPKQVTSEEFPSLPTFLQRTLLDLAFYKVPAEVTEHYHAPDVKTYGLTWSFPIAGLKIELSNVAPENFVEIS